MSEKMHEDDVNVKLVVALKLPDRVDLSCFPACFYKLLISAFVIKNDVFDHLFIIFIIFLLLFYYFIIIIIMY